MLPIVVNNNSALNSIIFSNLVKFFRSRKALDENSAIELTDLDLIEIGFPSTDQSKVLKLYPFIIKFDNKFYLDTKKMLVWRNKQQKIVTNMLKILFFVFGIIIAIIFVLAITGILNN